MDYPNSACAKALQEGKGRYLVFEGKLTKPEQTETPYGKRSGRNHETPPPCTLNGFIACRSDEILPEFEVNVKNQYPEHGSVIWIVVKGKRQKGAVFDRIEKRFIPAENFYEEINNEK